MAMNPFGGALGQYDQRAEREYYERQMCEKQQEYYRGSLNQAADLQRQEVLKQEAQKQAANQSKAQKRRKAILLLIGA